jgi:hypothetical protein
MPPIKCHLGLRRQSGAATALSGRTTDWQISMRLVPAKAVSRCACHRLVSPKPDEGGSQDARQKNGLVAGVDGVTVAPAIKTLPACDSVQTTCDD